MLVKGATDVYLLNQRPIHSETVCHLSHIDIYSSPWQVSATDMIVHEIYPMKYATNLL